MFTVIIVLVSCEEFERNQQTIYSLFSWFSLFFSPSFSLSLSLVLPDLVKHICLHNTDQFPNHRLFDFDNI